MTRVINKIFGDSIKGISLARNRLTRQFPYSLVLKNGVVNTSEEFDKRNGFQLYSQYSYHSFQEDTMRGLSSFYLKDTDGTLFEITMCWMNDPTDGLRKLHAYTGANFIIVAYTGVGVGTLELVVNAGVWTATLKVDGVAVTNWPKTYGTGLEATPSTVSTLVDNINSETDWTCVVAHGGVVGTYTPVAVLGPIESTVISSEGIFFYFGCMQPISTGPSVSAYIQDFTTESFTNPNAIVLNNVVYWARDQQGVISAGVNAQYIFKYDGYECYRVGLPTVEIFSLTNGIDGTNLPAGTYTYRVRLRREDFRENTVYSKFVDLEGTAITVTDGGSGGRDAVTIKFKIGSYLDDYRIKSAVVNGAQIDVTTITVAIGHTIELEDTVYVSEVSSGVRTTVRTLVVDSTSTTITVSKVVSVVDGAYISNVVTEVYRTIESGALFYYAGEQALSTIVTTSDYSDQLPDVSLVLNAELVEPAITRDAPPPARFICTHQDLAIYAGVPGREQEVFISDITNPEYVPDSNTIDVSSSGLGNVNGLGSDGERLYIFKEKSYTIVHGNLKIIDPGQPPDIYVETINTGIGCVSHDTIKSGEDLDGRKILYFLSFRGPQRLVNGHTDPEFNTRLAPYFKDLIDTDSVVTPDIGIITDKVYFKHATAVYDALRKWYIVAVPIESGVNSNYIYTSTVKLLVYEERLEGDLGDRWYDWSSDLKVLGGTGGMCIKDDRLHIAGTFNPTGTISRGYIARELRRTDMYRLADNTVAIDTKYHTPWEHFNNPSVYKRLNSIRLWRLTRANTVGGMYIARAYLDFVDETNSNNAFSSAKLDFSDVTTIEVLEEFIDRDFLSILIEIANSTIYEDLRFTGIELGYFIDYEGGDLEPE